VSHLKLAKIHYQKQYQNLKHCWAIYSEAPFGETSFAHGTNRNNLGMKRAGGRWCGDAQRWPLYHPNTYDIYVSAQGLLGAFT